MTDPPARSPGVMNEDPAERVATLIDPSYKFFRKIRGQVIEPAADGPGLPAPFATVTVYDVDFGLLAWSPVDSLHSWFYPFDIRRDQLATVTTDERGRFCVWVPRFDPGHHRRWRLERECHLDWPRRPDAPPSPTVDDPVLAHAARVVDPHALGGLREMLRVVRPRDRPPGACAALARPAFPQASRPPAREAARALAPATHARLAARVGVPAELLAAFVPQRAHGPFPRRRDRRVPEWSTILDAPDLSFEVTRDRDRDVRDDLFAVRWDEPDPEARTSPRPPAATPPPYIHRSPKRPLQ